MRRIFIIGTLILVVALGVVFMFASRGVDRYRPQIQAQIQKQLGRSIRLGHLGLRLFPLSLKADGLTVQDDMAFQSAGAFATADEVFVSVGLVSLLSGRPDVQSITLTSPKIELIRNIDGAWNYSTLGNRDDASSGNSEFILGQLRINDGQIGYTDKLRKQSRSVYDHINIELLHFAPRHQFDLTLAAHLPGPGKQMLSFSGKVGPLNTNNPSVTPIAGHITTQELTLSGLNRFVPGAIPSDDDAVATGEMDLSTLNQNLLVKGDLKLVDAVVVGAKLGFPVSAHYNFNADRNSDILTLRSTSIGLGQTSFNLNGSINAGVKPANLNLHVVTQNSSIAELRRLAGAFGLTASSYQMKGAVSADLTASGSPGTLQFQGSVNARNLDISGGEIKQPIQVSAIDLSFSPTTVRSNAFTAKSGRTDLQIQFALADYSTSGRTIDTTIRTESADIAQLLDMAKAYGFAASRDVRGTGQLSLNLRAQGSMSNMSALTLTGHADVTDASIQSPNLTKSAVVRNVKVQFLQNLISATDLNASIGNSTVTGSFSAKDLSAPQFQFALSADKIDTSELQHLINPKNQQAGNSARAGSISLMDKVTGAGTLSATTIKAENIVLNNFRATCKLDRGIIELSPMTTDLFGGKEVGTITFNTRLTDPAVSLNAKLSGVDSNALLAAVSSVRDTLFGSLSAHVNLNFTLAAASSDLARSMNGTLDFNLTNGHLKNINILSEISKVGKFLQSSPSGNTTGTDLKRLSGTMDIKSGMASTTNLTAALDAGSLSATGLVNLVDQGLNMHVNAILAQETSQSVGGSAIGGYLNTALANKKGELILPVIVTGTTSHPLFAPDLAALAKMKLSNLLPTSGDPSKLSSGILGAVTGKQGATGILNQILGGNTSAQGQKDPKSNQQSQDPINSILQQFGKKKPKQ